MIARLTTALALIALPALVVLTGGDQVRAATLTASYEAGHLDVSINDYRTSGMGTFRLVDGGTDMPALCIEADQSHSTADDAYRAVATGTPSDELDILIWLITQAPPDDDTATAAAALAWFYAGAKRSIGPPVWSNWALGYQPIGPLSPESWDSLAPFGLSHPVGLRTGRSDLDTAERRVAALHRRVLELAGPWQLTAHPDRGGFRLAGAAGPIGGQQVTITITAPGSAPTTSLVLTGADGYAAALVDPSAMADGATIDASLNAPGPHREWDGDGSVQRMITSTQVHLTARFEVAPAPRHVTVSKQSTDPTIGVADGVFALTDANGIEVERVVTDGNGRAWFAPIDPALHPQPYTVSEVEPPPGLAANATAVIVSDASTDAERPTVTEFTNEPLTAELVVRKELSAPVGPDDKSGFGFSIVRTQDGRSVEVSSDSTGTTAPVTVSIGTYEICETKQPGWAATLVDGGCQTIEIDLERVSVDARITVPYSNLVPPPAIDTAARDASDGDQVLDAAGGRLVDTVTLTGLVPESLYTLIAEVVRLGRDQGSDLHEVLHTSSIDFVPDIDSAELAVEFDVAPLESMTLVVTERLVVGETVVAVHDDLTDRDQTVTVMAPATTTTTAATTPTPPASTSPTPTSTSTTTTTTTTTTTVQPSSTLPRTGGDDAAQLLRLGDIGFVIGVALIALAGLLPRRPGDHH